MQPLLQNIDGDWLQNKALVSPCVVQQCHGNCLSALADPQDSQQLGDSGLEQLVQAGALVATNFPTCHNTNMQNGNIDACSTKLEGKTNLGRVPNAERLCISLLQNLQHNTRLCCFGLKHLIVELYRRRTVSVISSDLMHLAAVAIVDCSAEFVVL